MSQTPSAPSTPRAPSTSDGRTLTPAQVAAHEGIQRRLTWPSMHWGVEGVHPDAWPHIAMAAADAILAEFDVTPRGEDRWEYGVRWGDDGTVKNYGSRERAESRAAESHGDKVVRRTPTRIIPHGEWEEVRA